MKNLDPRNKKVQSINSGKKFQGNFEENPKVHPIKSRDQKILSLTNHKDPVIYEFSLKFRMRSHVQQNIRSSKIVQSSQKYWKSERFLIRFLSLRMKIIALIQLNSSRQNNLVPERGLWFVVVLSFCGFQGDLESPKDLK